MLPTNEFLLTVADICHNFLPNRKYDTLAIGVVGKTPFKTHLILGINSPVFDEDKLTKDRIVPPAIRNNTLIKKLKIEVLQEPYHAETSIVLYAKEHNLKIFGLASSRKICNICSRFIQRHIHHFDADCTIVDAWKDGGRLLTQKERQSILDFDSPILNNINAAREP